jgi:hypothetical protein
MLSKVIILCMLAIIVYNLARGMVFLVRDRGQSERTVKALSWRVGLSLGLFIALFAAFRLGLIAPHSL